MENLNFILVGILQNYEFQIICESLQGSTEMIVLFNEQVCTHVNN